MPTAAVPAPRPPAPDRAWLGWVLVLGLHAGASALIGAIVAVHCIDRTAALPLDAAAPAAGATPPTGVAEGPAPR